MDDEAEKDSAGGGDDEKPAAKGKKEPPKVAKSDDDESEGRAEASWTKTISKMKKVPQGEVAGKLDGIDFEPDKVELSGGRLVFSKGKRRVFAEAEVDVVLFTGPNDDVSGKKLIVNGKIRAGEPHINMSVMRKGDKLPNTQGF